MYIEVRNIKHEAERKMNSRSKLQQNLDARTVQVAVQAPIWIDHVIPLFALGLGLLTVTRSRSVLCFEPALVDFGLYVVSW